MTTKSYVLIAISLLVTLVGCQGGTQTMDIEALVNSGRAYLEAGNYAEAITALETAAEQASDNSDAHFLLGQAYNQNGELSKAADEFRTVLELDPENAAAHHNLGVTYYQLQDLEAALEQFEQALSIEPDDPDSHYQLGATYLTLALSGRGGGRNSRPPWSCERTCPRP